MKKIVSILLITTMLFSQLIAYAADVQEPTITFKELAMIELSDVEEISIRSGTTGEGVTISSKVIIENVLKKINNMELKEYKDTVGGGRGGWSYSVMFGLSDNSSIHYTCSTGTEINNKKYEATDDTEVRKCLEHYYNLYKNINSSTWATETIAEAVEYGIINGDNSWNFPSSICREDFCNIAVKMIESTGVTLSTENPQRPLGIKDTDNINVLKLYKAGVILGKEHHKTGITFAPEDFITREEAATILYRISRYCLNLDMPQSAYNESVSFYSDKDMISDWAFEAVFYLKELGVMLGTSDNEFSPKGSYTVEQTVATMVRLYNATKNLKGLNIMLPLECDAYNGQVFIDSYPKAWQGFESKPIASSNGYFNILPGKLLYSYDRENWNLLYEDVDGKRVYHNIPDDVNIDGARYAWEYNCFVNAPFDANKSYYSYDNKEWIEGKPENKKTVSSVDIAIDELPHGITKDSIIYDSESGLYLSWQPYEENDYFSERYQTTLTEVKYDTIWASVDTKEWTKITIPEEVLFFTSAGINTQAKAIIIDAAIEFTDEEKSFIDEEEKKAEKLGQGYDKPKYKIEKYIVMLSTLRDIICAESSVELNVKASANDANKEIFFYVPSIEKTPIEKQDDGWYKFPEKVVALFPFPSFDYEKPTSVTAIFTPTGTEMDTMAKEIAKIEPPYMYHSMAEVLNMEISLPSDAIRGHLFFRFEFEGGSVEDSQYFNVYQE